MSFRIYFIYLIFLYIKIYITHNIHKRYRYNYQSRLLQRYNEKIPNKSKRGEQLKKQRNLNIIFLNQERREKVKLFLVQSFLVLQIWHLVGLIPASWKRDLSSLFLFDPFLPSPGWKHYSLVTPPISPLWPISPKKWEVTGTSAKSSAHDKRSIRYVWYYLPPQPLRSPCRRGPLAPELRSFKCENIVTRCQSNLITVLNCKRSLPALKYSSVWSVVTSRQQRHQSWALPTESVMFEYLCSDSASKAPHSFVRSVVLTTTPHFKGEGDRISLHLQILIRRRKKKKEDTFKTWGKQTCFS